MSMRIHDVDPLASVRRAMGQPSPPDTITQTAFDFDDGHLWRLVGLKPGDRAERADLSDYAHDLLYTEIQGPLLAYVLPFCLQAWHDDLRGMRDYGAFVEHFYPALANRHIFETYLTHAQTAAVSEFMRESILAEIDAQRGLAYVGMKARPYRWICALTTYGVLLPDVDRVWTQWWSIDTIGRAISAVQYISALMYPDDHNPIFAPWTAESGGGPPCLWEFGGHLYSHRWLAPNVDFLRRTLTVSAIDDVLQAAVDRLTTEPEREVAARVRAEMPSRIEMLAARCAELPTLLATTQEAQTLLAWS